MLGGLILTFAGMIVNYLSFRENDMLKWAFRNHGGEITIEYGFGLRAVHIYGMRPDQATTHSLHISILGFLASVFAGAVIVWVVLTVSEIIKNRSA